MPEKRGKRKSGEKKEKPEKGGKEEKIP